MLVKKQESNASKPNNRLIENERKYHQIDQLIIGIDEAGRAPLAGPVVAAAVHIHNQRFHAKIDDSKKISEKKRAIAFEEIVNNAVYGVGIVSEAVIDEINILEATFLAMNKAVLSLVAKLPQDVSKNVCLLVDGNRFKTELPYPYHTITQGDSLLFSIACASIVAKVTRDHILKVYDQLYPQYGFSRHKGYPTKGHKSALRKYGPTILHRRSFSY